MLYLLQVSHNVRNCEKWYRISEFITCKVLSEEEVKMFR